MYHYSPSSGHLTSLGCWKGLIWKSDVVVGELEKKLKHAWAKDAWAESEYLVGTFVEVWVSCRQVSCNGARHMNDCEDEQRDLCFAAHMFGQLLSRSDQEKVDIWAAGCILIELWQMRELASQLVLVYWRGNVLVQCCVSGDQS